MGFNRRKIEDERGRLQTLKPLPDAREPNNAVATVIGPYAEGD
jgi:hypothetical protein